MPTTPTRQPLRDSARRLIAAAALTFAIGTLAACGDDDEPSDTTVATTLPSSTSSPTDTTTPTDSTTGIANPASEFCIDMGGTLEIVDEAGGQVGYCVLPDGTRVEEWEYFENNGSTTTAP